MKLFTSKMLERLMSEQKKKSEGLLPEIVKRLIQSKCSDLSYLRVPDGDDIWAPGYDGIVVNETKTTYVAQGKSVWEFGTNSDSLEKLTVIIKTHNSSAWSRKIRYYILSSGAKSVGIPYINY